MTERLCPQCGKDISNKHPNAKFCSNKGSGNCKDLFNNRLPHRIDRARAFVGEDVVQSESSGILGMIENKLRQDPHTDHEHEAELAQYYGNLSNLEGRDFDDALSQ